MRSELETIRPELDTSALAAFSQVHLATKAERAVYRRFASDPEACWSDTEIALVSRREISDIRWALDRFAEAGIVELVEEGCYRWRPALRYVLERSEPDPGRLDPVCGMPVAADAPHRAEDVFGRTERFCSERCLEMFVIWPVAFTRPQGKARPGDRLEA